MRSLRLLTLGLILCSGCLVKGKCLGPAPGYDAACPDEEQPVTSCNKSECPPLNGYTVKCNAQTFCEYHRTDPTGPAQEHDAWVYMPPASFPMGSSDDEPGREDSGVGTEGPVHTVTFSRGFLIGLHEVTAAQYEACELAGSCTKPEVTGIRDRLGWGLNRASNARGAHPQNFLRFREAEAVCRFLGARLPSSAEWEYAAVGPRHRKFPLG